MEAAQKIIDKLTSEGDTKPILFVSFSLLQTLEQFLKTKPVLTPRGSLHCYHIGELEVFPVADLGKDFFLHA